MKVHLIDGTYELFRSYYGAPEAKGADGQEVGAARGLIRSLNAFLREPDVTHVAVAFDHVIESFRNDLYDGYKTGEGMDPDLFAQFPLAEEGCRALGLVVWPMIEFEADDGLASGAAKFSKSKSVEQVVICSPDKDLAQCVRGNDIICFDRKQDKIYNQQGVWDKFGVGPESIADLLGLVGDSADGFPGIPKWGMKSASTALAEYTHLEKIPKDSAKWKMKLRGAEGLALSLRENYEDARLFKKLATLRTDAPIEEKLSDLKWRGYTPDLKGFAEKIGDERLQKLVK
jgi:5'-3' exonuclease